MQKELQTTNLHQLKGNDAYFRINYLYQLSLLYVINNPPLSQYFMQQCKEICQKMTMRMTAQMKQTHCKKCSFPLLEFKISKITHKLFIIKKCEHCKYLNKTFVK